MSWGFNVFEPGFGWWAGAPIYNAWFRMPDGTPILDVEQNYNFYKVGTQGWENIGRNTDVIVGAPGHQARLINTGNWYPYNIWLWPA